MRYFESYGCTCVSPWGRKRDLPGYCPKHGDPRQMVANSEYRVLWEGPCLCRDCRGDDHPVAALDSQGEEDG